MKNQNMKKSMGRKRGLMTSLIATLFAPMALMPASVALAQSETEQSSSGGLEEVTVTSQRREEGAQHVPIAISVFSGDFLANHINDVEDVANLTPNFQFTGLSDPGGLSKSQNSLRGLGLTNGGNVVINTTSILTYYDGVASGTPFASAIPTWDLDRIEIARGPQGTLFGRNALAGLIQNISASPTRTFEGFGQYSVGEYDLRRFEGAISGPITDNIRARFSALYYSRGGDVTNVFYDIEQGEQQYWGARGIVEWDISEQMNVRAKYQNFKGDVDSIFFQGAPSQDYAATTQAFFNALDTPTFDFDMDLDRKSNFRKIQSGLRDPYEDYDVDMIELDVSYNFGPASLSVVLGKLDGSTERLFDGGDYPLPWITILESAGIDQKSAEIRLTSTTDSRFQWITGAYYQDTDDFGITNGYDQSGQSRDLDADGLTRYNADSPEDHFDGLFVGLDGNGNSTGYVASNKWTDDGAYQKLETTAFFLHTTFRWTDRLTTTQAARWSREELWNGIQLQSSFEGPVSEGVVGGSLQEFDDWIRFAKLGHAQKRAQALSFIENNTVDAAGNVILSERNATWNKVTWRLAADYRITDDRLLYSSISTGFKGGQFSTFRVIPGFSTAVDPAEATVYEIGAKTQWFDHRLQINVAAFHNAVENFHAAVRRITPLGVIDTLGNIPKAEINGVELEVQALPWHNLLIAANVGVLDTEITEVTPENAALRGNELPLSENLNFNGLVRYDIATAIGKFSPELSWAYHGKYWSDHNNYDTGGELGDYWTADVRLGYGNEKGVYALLALQNITDEVRVVRNEVPNADLLGHTLSAINKRRSWQLNVGYRF